MRCLLCLCLLWLAGCGGDPVPPRPSVVDDARPWELPIQEFSWSDDDPRFSVAVAFNQDSHVKTAPDVEHRYVEIRHKSTTDPEEVLVAANRVWQHFVREIEERHPQANYKMVNVHMWVEGQDPVMPVGRLTNKASAVLPDEPEVEWHEWVGSPLEFERP